MALWHQGRGSSSGGPVLEFSSDNALEILQKSLGAVRCDLNLAGESCLSGFLVLGG